MEVWMAATHAGETGEPERASTSERLVFEWELSQENHSDTLVGDLVPDLLIWLMIVLSSVQSCSLYSLER
jgi:hypothetical protein